MTRDEIKTKYRQYVAEAIKMAVDERVSFANIKYARFDLLEDSANKLVARLSAFVYGLEVDRIVVNKQWPATWWDAVKERWFPNWAKQRWPVRWDSVEVDEPKFIVCPHLDVPGQESHVRWVVGEAEQYKLERRIK